MGERHTADAKKGSPWTYGHVNLDMIDRMGEQRQNTGCQINISQKRALHAEEVAP